VKEKMKKILLFFQFILLNGCHAWATQPPSDFVQLQPSHQMKIVMAYAGADNFIGRAIPGYRAAHCYLTEQAASRLHAVASVLAKENLGLWLHDCYRPQEAVDYFYQWSLDPADTKNQALYYPSVPKAELFQREYIALKSGHSRGSTVDLTLFDLRTQRPLDMGSRIDFMGVISHPSYMNLSKQARYNRARLQTTMQQYGFVSYPYEWWHFTLQNEPYPNRYFNFPVQ
jgi:D-alanyl-D-alanine dipeptidase